MRPDIPSIEDVRQKTEDYLAGSVALDDYTDWIDDWESHISTKWRTDHRGEAPTGTTVINGITLPCHEMRFPLGSAEEMISTIELMDTEMICFGSFRTEEMFRADLRSLLDGKPMTAFKLDWAAYERWCEDRATQERKWRESRR